MFEWLRHLWGHLWGTSPTQPADADCGETEPADAHFDDDIDPGEPFTVEITEELDLHGFNPRETRNAIEDYLEEAAARGYRTVRIAHGRGKGVQKQITQSVLAKHPRVASYRDDGANFGATIVTLTPDP